MALSPKADAYIFKEEHLKPRQLSAAPTLSAQQHQALHSASHLDVGPFITTEAEPVKNKISKVAPPVSNYRRTQL
jgi:hypothetical protein